MPKDYYQILGVAKNATQEEIKRAFHKLAHKYHPHKGGDEKKFKEINEAYQVLSNSEKRRQYDQFGRVFDGGPSDSQWAWGQPSQDFGFDFDFGDIGDIGDVFGDIFGFGVPRKRKKDFKRGKDVEVNLEISLEETLRGEEKEISLQKYVVCSRCQGKGAEPGTKVNECFSCRGTGQVQQIQKTFLGSFTRVSVCPECGGEGFRPEKACNVCKGEGRVKAEEKIKVFIPAGVDNNQIIKVEAKGDAGRKGGKTGDLYVRIFVRPHRVFARKGDDLFMTLPITFAQAALGDEIEISALEATKILLKIPSGAESGKILRISGKGVPRFSGYGRGNLYVEMIVKTPQKLTKKQKEILEQLKKEGL